MGKVERPIVTLTYAQSLDGSIAARRGEPLPISSPESQRMTHQLRAQHDAILVGIGTVLADDPELTVRLIEGDSPQPVVLDSRLRFPVTARLLGNLRQPWIITAENIFAMSGASVEQQKVLESNGAHIIPVPAQADGRVNLSVMLMKLYSLGIKSIMVEGGAQVIESFLRSGFVDEVILTVAPMFVGGLRPFDAPLQTKGAFPRLDSPTVEPCGSDWIVRGRLKQSPDAQ